MSIRLRIEREGERDLGRSKGFYLFPEVGQEANAADRQDCVGATIPAKTVAAERATHTLILGRSLVPDSEKNMFLSH